MDETCANYINWSNIDVPDTSEEKFFEGNCSCADFLPKQILTNYSLAST